MLHLGCGLDGRVYRLAPPPAVRWFDVDYPNVIALREQVYPQREGYRMIGSSVTDLEWMDEVPPDQPTLVVAEGLTMYLRREQGEALLRTLVDTFGTGEMMFDVYNTAAIRLQRFNPVLRGAGATLHWGIDDPRELEKFGLTLLARRTAADFISPETRSRMSVSMRLQLRLLDLLPPLRNMGQLLRYQF
ncbi:MAG: class I SAM-dependent methyltransferase [Pseudonocardiaceae bacterium]